MSPSFKIFRDSAASRPLFPDFNYTIIINPDTENSNLEYCYNYPFESVLKTGITEKKQKHLHSPI